MIALEESDWELFKENRIDAGELEKRFLDFQEQAREWARDHENWRPPP